MVTLSTSGFEAAAAVVVGLAVFTLLFKLIRFWLCSLKDAQEADAADRRAARAPSDGDGGRRVALVDVVSGIGAGSGRDGRVVVPPPPPQQQQPAAPVAVAVETARSTEPLVCTYLRADGWPAEAACAVCLAELADGEALRVLPACMHYFHAACVGEWLRAHRTCPLCRAPLDPAAAAGGA